MLMTNAYDSLMTKSLTPIALCADDYGQNGAIDAAIEALLALGRLSAVSCFSTAPRWQQHSAPWLREQLREQASVADFGLHFNLTENFNAGPGTSLSALILRSYLKQLDPEHISTLLHQQLDAFEAELGQMPDFIDGHQHVHQLPIVRKVLLTVLATRYPERGPWIRNTLAANPQWHGKTDILKFLGGNALAKTIASANIATNNGFAGVYDFNTSNYADRFEEWLKSARTGMLVMCHPGISRHANDAISAQRIVEYLFFSSARFPEMLDQHGVQLAKLSVILAASTS
jgi:predicted glycoside hydrolase/deacetylase ChbG (UPF0249 family)